MIRVAIGSLHPCAKCGHVPKHVVAHGNADAPLVVHVGIACKCGERFFPFDMTGTPMLTDTRVAEAWNGYQAASNRAKS